MSGLKTLFCGLAFIWAGPTWSDTVSQRAQNFATCAGRFSALVEFERLFDGAASEQAEIERELFVALLEATLPDATDLGVSGRVALAWRIEAKMAQAQLLTRGAFDQNKDVAEFSRRQSAHFLSVCRMLALGV